jgi:uracil-DNA glycosylase family 4
MGADELFLDGLTREEALELVERARAAYATPRGEEPPSVPAADAGGRSGQPKPSERPTASPQPTASSSATHADASAPTAESASHDADAPLPDDYDALRELALGCTRCRLCEGRTQVVFSDGPRDASLMVVGEAPGANEDKTGLPFVGAAGKYLDLLLATVGLSREESVYIANVLKCRPPGNRDPKPDEIETCSPYLRKQIDLVQPGALLAVGSFSGKLLTGRDKSSLGRLRGEVHSYHGVPLVVTYHPAALLRNRRWVRAFWDDLQLLRSVLERQAVG